MATSPSLFLLGEAQGESEAKIGAGFVGASGIELLRMLNEAGVIELTTADYGYLSRYYSTSDPHLIDSIWRLHPEVYRSNVFQLRPAGNRIEALCGPKSEALPGYPALVKGKHIRAEFRNELERLGDELVSINPNLILALGNSALWALCGKTGVSKLRGTTMVSTHCASGFKLLPTYHPAAVIRQWELRPVTVMDLTKAKREATESIIRRPPREIWIEPTLEDIHEFFERFLRKSRTISVDIETSGNQITHIGFAADASRAIVIPFFDSRNPRGCYWKNIDNEKSCWRLIADLLEDRSIGKVFQNGLYDIAFLWRAYGIKVYGASEDTMLLHHSLQPESLKGLGFLGSIYTDEGAWKHDRKHVTTIKRDE